MEKKFYFVRSKIDNDLSNEKRTRRNFNEEEIMDRIKNNCVQGLQKEGFESPQVFLVSSFDLHLYDFHLLEETLERELPEQKRHVLLLAMPSINLEVINRKKKALQAKIKYYASLSALGACVPIPGLSFAADVAMLVEATTMFKVTFGLDTGRFRENDVKLGREIQKMEKKFYFVRSKIDNDLSNEKRTRRNFNEEEIMDRIKNNCVQGLQKEGFESPQVFLVSSFDLHLYDFHLLEETLERELPEQKRHVLLLAMPSINLEVINRKKKVLQAKIKYYASLSALGACVPIPGLSFAADVAMLVEATTMFKVTFGLATDEYLKKVEFEKFDFFIIISAGRFRENDVKLAREIKKMEKKFYFVRSKIDNDLSNEKRTRKNFNQKETMDQIRKNCVQGMQRAMDNPLSYKLIQEIKEALQNNGPASAAAKVQEYLDQLNNTPLNIGITGESGSGKSSFVNAFRGIDHSNERAAPTGCVETTLEVRPYPHPNYPNVTLWDLPGIGTPNFPADEYLKKVEFEKFDFFIIISADRFRENDVKLAREIQKMEKKFYFVRSKIDHNLNDEEKTRRDFNKDETMDRIRENCVQGLQKEGVESPQVFLVSSFDLHLYDFHLLEETLERELPAHKKHVLLLAMQSINLDAKSSTGRKRLEIINRKKEALQSKIKYVALASALVASVPIPGLSTATDIAMLITITTIYKVAFRLDSESLKNLSLSANVPLNNLRAEMKSLLAVEEINKDLIIKLLLMSASNIALMAAEEVTRFIPLIAIPAAMALSVTFTYKALSTFLYMLAEDAQRVFKRALGLNTSV
ncbi:hypothetical protein L3Q82_008315 [Scortum barcoo]|uniref:Uncharacterized protein n=1 Tax=Scortum barcoo TaxID=214431 RepID=A0ACB8WI69_9TELE|nr:hypothetical protein L3Q82_008315 [Scortum barcoo]